MFVIVIKNKIKDITFVQYYAGSKRLTNNLECAMTFKNTTDALTIWTYNCIDTLPDLHSQNYQIHIAEIIERK